MNQASTTIRRSSGIDDRPNVTKRALNYFRHGCCYTHHILTMAQWHVLLGGHCTKSVTKYQLHWEINTAAPFDATQSTHFSVQLDYFDSIRVSNRNLAVEVTACGVLGDQATTGLDGNPALYTQLRRQL